MPLGLAALCLAACGGSKNAATTSTQATVTDAAGCITVTPPPAQKRHEAKPTKPLDASKTYDVKIQTNCGSFTIRLATKTSPATTASFVSLAQKGFFDNTVFHRIVPGFVIQGGDPKGNGTGGPGYKVVEAPPKTAQYTKGVVAMAKTQLEAAGTSGSQFFVVTGQDAQLPPDYAVLGKVTGGQDTVDRIAAADTDPSTEEPVDPIVIRSVTVATK
jgi:cyclophilin family peptidyl-prolyl cis-trans isomerase